MYNHVQCTLWQTFSLDSSKVTVTLIFSIIFRNQRIYFEGHCRALSLSFPLDSLHHLTVSLHPYRGVLTAYGFCSPAETLCWSGRTLRSLLLSARDPSQPSPGHNSPCPIPPGKNSILTLNPSTFPFIHFPLCFQQFSFVSSFCTLTVSGGWDLGCGYQESVKAVGAEQRVVVLSMLESS